MRGLVNMRVNREGLYLTAWNGTGYTLDRIGRGFLNLKIDRVLLVRCSAATQPGRISGISVAGHRGGRGDDA